MTSARAASENAPAQRRFQRVMLAPLLAFVVLAAWAVASPVGAAPDDDYHLTSIWCALGGSSKCEPGPDASSRFVSPQFGASQCFVQDRDESAACIYEVSASGDSDLELTRRGNFSGEYPPLFHAAMRVFAGEDIESSVLNMRLFNAALFVGLATALATLLLPVARRSLFWGWLVVLIPLGMFLIPSTNPSGWATIGVGTAFFALRGWLEEQTRRRWAFAALYMVGMVMAAGSRGDAAVYAVGATIAALILSFVRERRWALGAVLPGIGVLLALALYSTASQGAVGGHGFSDGGAESVPGLDAAAPAAGFALAAYNLLQLPDLWTGVWGTWGLGWLDTPVPAVVVWGAVSAFVVVGFAGLGKLDWRKVIAATGVFVVLVVLPVYVLTVGGDQVGAQLQPRYLLPLIALFAFILVSMPKGARGLGLTRFQTLLVLGTLGVANLIALEANIRRYVTGTDVQGIDLDAGAEWWWPQFLVGPTVLWLAGSLAYAGLLATLWTELRRVDGLTPSVAAPTASA